MTCYHIAIVIATKTNGENKGKIKNNLEWKMERIRIDGATGGCEKGETICLMDVEGCGL